MSDTTKQPEITTYYNGACPVCRFEIEHYRDRAERKRVDSLGFCDIAAKPENLSPLGLTQDEAERRLYVRTRDGEILGGIDAFVAIWRRLPGYGWLARLASLPLIRPAVSFVYERAAAPLIYRWSKRRRERLARKAATSS